MESCIPAPAMRLACFVLTAVLVSGCGLIGDSAGGKAAVKADAVFEGPVAKAICQAGDHVEDGLQGQVPPEARASGMSALSAYNCNLTLVGQWTTGADGNNAATPALGDGAAWQHAWFEDCAYYATGALTNGGSTAPRPAQLNPGVVVVDATDSTRPVATEHLATPGMLDPWESLKVADRRKLLVGTNAIGGSIAGDGGPEVDVYDLAGDCRHPKLLSSTAVGTANGHEGYFTPDGMTYYATGSRAIDMTDPVKPALLGTAEVTSHGGSTSVDGTRAYAVGASCGNGMKVVDVGAFQARKANPEAPTVGEVCWTDGGVAQHTQPFTMKGHRYVLFVDEGGLVSGAAATGAGGASGGLVGVAGAARIIDIEDEKNPRVVSKLKLEVHMPENAQSIGESTDGTIFGYQGHYCTLSDGVHDNNTYALDDPVMAICGYFQSGIRVFDIRDVMHPREIAYYNPPASPGYHPGSNYNMDGECGTADWASANSRYRPDRNEIWFTTQCNAFQIVKFEKPLAELLGPAPGGG
ncbi:MAG TPA: hypothetical protein VM369_09300 [Candidatus Binatia bacterium]|nr:hypothetical protein [Candidatus Binatia bacterium]